MGSACCSCAVPGAQAGSSASPVCSGKAKLPKGSNFPVLQLMQSEVLSAGGQEQCKQFTLLLQGCYNEAGKWPHKGNPGGSWEYTDKHNSPLI